MKVQIYGKNVTITQGMQEKVEKKLQFLDKYFIIEDHLTANVVVKVYNNDVKVEITIPTKGLCSTSMTFPLTQSDNLVKSGEISTESPIFISLQFIYVRKDKEKPKHISTISSFFYFFQPRTYVSATFSV